jgi:hypothetical protein
VEALVEQGPEVGQRGLVMEQSRARTQRIVRLGEGESMLMMKTATPPICEKSRQAGAPRPGGPREVSSQAAEALAPQLADGGNIAGSDHVGGLTATGTPALTDLSTPAVLEPTGSQWAIKLPDGRVIPTGTGQERTERDAEWENNNPQGRGGCSAVVRDAYRTPWRPVEDPAPVVEPGTEAAKARAAEVADLHAQVADLVDLMLYYRHLAAKQAKTCPLPTGHTQDPAAPTRRRLRLPRPHSQATHADLTDSEAAGHGSTTG